jgi:hypothetical protein
MEYACGCGLFYNQTYNSSLFVIFSLDYYYGSFSTNGDGPEVVWSANPNNPVGINAGLQLTSERGLVLQDANGTIAWSTNISSKSVAALNLTDMCNLVLLDEQNATIWQSFDHPTDTLVLGQKLVAGQNLTSQGGLNKFSLSLTSEGWFAYINSNPPQCYFSYNPDNVSFSYVQFHNQSLDFFRVNEPSPGPLYDSSDIPITSKYMRFGPDGHLRVYDSYWDEVSDFLQIGYCRYPTACGNYGICTNDQCSCPRAINGTNYFRAVNDMLPNLGCSLVTPLSCEASENHILLELHNITYFAFQTPSLRDIISPDHRHIDLENCKKACLKDCSCKAAIYNSSNLVGNCYLQSQIFSLMSIDEKQETYFNVYIKVHKVQMSQLVQFLLDS